MTVPVFSNNTRFILPVDSETGVGFGIKQTDNKPHVMSELVDQSGEMISVQYPLPTDGDSIYAKDVDIENCIMGSFSGIPTDAFDNLYTLINNETSENPKIITFMFKRTIEAHYIGIGCLTNSNFSNVKLKLVDGSGYIRATIDNSTNNTKYTSYDYAFAPEKFDGFILEFHTIDPVCITNIVIKKVISVTARIKAVRLDGEVIDIGAREGDSGYNLNVSVDQTEPTTNSLKTITYSHSELHAGTHYSVKSFSSILKAGVKEILIVTPDTTKWAHMIIGFNPVESSVVFELFRDVTTSNDGVPVSKKNRNENFPDNNTTLIYEDPTITAGDTIANLRGKVFLGAGKNSGGGIFRDIEERVLKQNTKYLLRITEQNLQATVVNWDLDWYEHTNIS